MIVILPFVAESTPKVWDIDLEFAMSDSDRRPDEEATEELLADMPLPSDAKTFFLGGIFVLSMLTAAYVASEIVLPMIFAVMLNLLMQPTLGALERLWVPKALGALLLILFVIATICRTWRRRLWARRSVDS
jgi:hypothetical protein